MSDAHAYDEHPYTGYVYWFTHPDHLGVVGALHGLDTAPADGCRVLELGCGDGGNLVPLAAALPTSHFVGVDLCEAHIRAGTDLVGRLGLGNVELVRGDVATLEVPGTFDYIIAHGLFSWVPEATRAAALDLVQRALAPHGVALISYNAYPGWHDEAPVRRLMEFHTRPVAGAADKIQQARGIADWHCRRMVGLFGEERKGQMERVLGVVAAASDTLIRHDYLCEHHQPLYFEDFVARARARGLEFLANARPGKLRLGGFEPEVADMLRRVGDPVRRQQYMDFFAHTRFRETLLCRAGHAIQRDAAPRARLAALAAESRLDQDVWAPATRDAEAITVEAPAGAVTIAGTPLRIALSVLQRQAPRAVPLRELFQATLPIGCSPCSSASCSRSTTSRSCTCGGRPRPSPARCRPTPTRRRCSARWRRPAPRCPA